MEKIEHHNGAPDANGGDGIPRYAQIQKILEERLVDGTYPLGSLIPPEIELAAEFNSSRTTIREALRYLRERGYVERRQGVGTRVISDSPKSSYNQSYTSLEELFQVAIETYFVIMGVEKVALDHDQAELVGGLQGETWFRINGIRWTEVGGKPLCYVQSYIPERFEHLLPQLTDYQGPFFALLERHSGHIIEEVVQEIRAVPMPTDFERQLGLKPGSYSLQLLRRYVTEQGTLIASFNWHPAERMVYTMHIHRSKDSQE